jgi:hypothetical protein
MAVYEKTGAFIMGTHAGADVEVVRGLNAFRLTVFGILVGLGLTAGLGVAALLGPWPGVLAGVAAVVVTALALRFLRRPIATLMEWVLPGD